jgi:hypothetical protein
VTVTGDGEPNWRKSRRSGGGDCVEVAFVGTEVWLRDSKDPDGPKLIFDRSLWRSFLAQLVGIPPSRDGR